MKTCPMCDVVYADTDTRCPGDGALLVESRELAPGQMVRGKYRIIEKLGQGGMGTVYRAEDTFLSAQMALKFLSAELSSDRNFTRRFRDEARAAFKLRHPNIVEVYGLDQAEDGSLFISMEYVEGMSLRGLMGKVGGPFVVGGAMQIAHGIACGLGTAHSHGFVHRDIKPENIIVQRRGETVLPKILDFGIVAVMEKAQGADAPSERLSQAPILTAAYAAPEQWGFLRPDELDGRTDLYALGCVFYEMLAGRLPFTATSMEGWMEQHLKVEPVPPSTFNPEVARYGGLDEAVLWMIRKRREDRPADVEQLLGVLDGISDGSLPKAAGSQRFATVPEGGFAGVRAVAQTMPAWPQGAPLAPPPVVAQPAVAPRSSGSWLWAAAAVAAVVLLVLAGYAFRARKADAVKDEPGVTTPVSTRTEIADAPPPMPVLPVEEAKKREAASATVGPSTSAASAKMPPPSPKPERAVTETPGAMEKQAHALYAAGSYAQAGPLFERACNAGSAEGCRSAADMYAKAQGFAHDAAKVVALRNRSCEGGDMAACYQLSFNYNNADGVAKNMAKAETLRTEACNGGYAEACTKLGAMYLSEVGFKDEAKAARYYELACDRGSREGCWFIAKMYDLGKGVGRDEGKSKELYSKSCQLGYEQGCDALKAK